MSFLSDLLKHANYSRLMKYVIEAILLLLDLFKQIYAVRFLPSNGFKAVIGDNASWCCSINDFFKLFFSCSRSIMYPISLIEKVINH